MRHPGRRLERFQDLVCPPGSICALCGKEIIHGLRKNHPLGPSIDHIIPLEKGGQPRDLSNMQPAHFGCNARKGSGTMNATRPRTRDY